MDTLQGSVRDNAGTAARLGAPCNGFVFGVADGAVRVRRSPEAEIFGRAGKKNVSQG